MMIRRGLEERERGPRKLKICYREASSIKNVYDENIYRGSGSGSVRQVGNIKTRECYRRLRCLKTESSLMKRGGQDGLTYEKKDSHENTRSTSIETTISSRPVQFDDGVVETQECIQSGMGCMKINERQSSITTGMRIIVVDWLMQLSEEMQICKEVVHTGIAYLDRYCQLSVPKKDEYQLYGLVCLYIANKLERSSSPQLPVFLTAMPDSNCERALEIERTILVGLNFELHPVTFYLYIRVLLSMLVHYEEKFRTGIVRKEELGEGGWIMKKVFWMVDGVVMQPRTGHCKEDICLGIIYQVLKEYREGRHIHGGKNMAIDESFEENQYYDQSVVELVIAYEQFVHYLSGPVRKLSSIVNLPCLRIFRRINCTCALEGGYHPELRNMLWKSANL